MAISTDHTQLIQQPYHLGNTVVGVYMYTHTTVHNELVVSREIDLLFQCIIIVIYFLLLVG